MSFFDLMNNFTKPHENKSYKCKVITVQLYLVNLLSGKITRVDKAHIFDKKYIEPQNFCKIIPVISYKNPYANLLQFSVRDENKDDNKLTDIVWGKFYSGNYELFLHKKDAARKAKNILMKKLQKIQTEINSLETEYYI